MKKIYTEENIENRIDEIKIDDDKVDIYML